MKKILIVGLFFFCITNTQAQRRGLIKHRTLITYSAGFALVNRNDDLDIIYDPKTDSFKETRSPIKIPMAVGFNYVLSKRLTAKLQFGMYKSYAQVVTHNYTNGQQDLTRVQHPFLVRDFSIGFQWANYIYFSRQSGQFLTNKRYFSPICRSYFELEYTHSTYSLITQYINTKPDIQFGVVTLGGYKNFFFRNARHLIAFAGIRVGVPVYADRAHINYVPENTEGTVREPETWQSMKRQNLITNVFQVKIGVKYLLPF